MRIGYGTDQPSRMQRRIGRARQKVDEGGLGREPIVSSLWSWGGLRRASEKEYAYDGQARSDEGAAERRHGENQIFHEGRDGR